MTSTENSFSRHAVSFTVCPLQQSALPRSLTMPSTFRYIAFLPTVVVMTGPVTAAEPISFRRDVAPILISQCLACHGPKKAEGGYRVDSFEQLLKAGDSGEPGVIVKKPSDSELFRRLISEDEDERMPAESAPLADAQIASIKEWIAAGANYDAKDPSLPLSRIVPPPVHPPAPEAYLATLPITAMAFRPDGKELFVGGYHEVTVWNPTNGELIRRFGNVGQRIYALQFSPDGKTLAVGSGTPGSLGEVRLFDPTSGELKQVLMSTTDVVLDVRFNPAGDQLAVAAADGVLHIFDVQSGNEQLAITSHSDWVTAIDWHPDGSQLVAGSRDKTAKVFDAKSGDVVVTYSGHSQPVLGVAFHPDGKQVFSGAFDRKVHLWKIADGKKSKDVASFGGYVNRLQTSKGFLFAVSADRTARQFDRDSQKEVRKYSGHKESIGAVAFHADTKRLATGAFDGEVRVWNADDGKVVTTFTAAPGYPPPKK